MNYQFSKYQCSKCQAEYAPDEGIYTCPLDGNNLDVILNLDEIQSAYQPKDIFENRENSIWRYLPLLPVNDPGCWGSALRSVGCTPHYTPKRLAANLGLKHFWIKDEGRNPTGSFKDRASALVVARAQQIQADVIVTASTGNAGAALAGMAAAAGQQAVIFAPRSAPPAKIAQLLVFGAQVILVEGNYDSAFELAIQASQEFGWYNRNTGYNPFTCEGKKTAAFEIWEGILRDLGDDRLNIFVSVGDGNIITGIHKGFKDLMALGWITKFPRLFGVQAEGSAAVSQAFRNGTEIIHPVHSQTLADSISVDLPRDGLRALHAVKQTGGTFVTVTDQNILTGIKDLGSEGIFAEPAGAAAYAGLVQAINQKMISLEDKVLVINTGNGLKDIRAAMQAVPEAPIIEPTLSALKSWMGKA